MIVGKGAKGLAKTRLADLRPSLRVRPQSEFAHELAAYMALRAVWRANNRLYMRDRLGMVGQRAVTWQQEDICAAVQPEGARVSVRSGHAIGKSAISAGLLLWMLECFDYANVACTAPSGHQLRDHLWKELATHLRTADDLSQTRGDRPRFWLSALFKVVQDRIYDLSAAQEWFGAARTTSKEKPEGMQGLHAEHLLFLFEEASGIDEAVFEASTGLFASATARVLLIGNPTRSSGTFYLSHTKQRAAWTTLHFRSDESPLVDPHYRQTLVTKWGEGSNMVRVRSDGEFPHQDADVLIPLELAEPSLLRAVTPPLSGPRILGVDVAREGKNRTALVVRQGQAILHIEVHPHTMDTMAVVGWARACAETWKVDRIHVDAIGVGAGVADRLRELKQDIKAETIDVKVSETAPARLEGEIQVRSVRDWLWVEMADWFRTRHPMMGADPRLCEELVGECCTTKYRPTSVGLEILSKQEMYGKSGWSPDLADACGLTFYQGAWSPRAEPTIRFLDLEDAGLPSDRESLYTEYDDGEKAAPRSRAADGRRLLVSDDDDAGVGRVSRPRRARGQHLVVAEPRKIT